MAQQAPHLSPRVWPSYSDLARSLGLRLTSFKRLSPVHRVSGRQVIRKIGNEVKVPPQEAVSILAEAGLSPEAAEHEVADIVRRRSERVPALARRLPTGLNRSSVGKLEGNRLRHVFYEPPSAAPARTPDVARLSRLHQRLSGTFVPVEEYLRGAGD